MYRIHAGFFLVAFLFGISVVCLIQPKKEVIRKFPNPWNQDTVFKDSSNACYVYDAKHTACPKDKSSIKQQPLMEDYTNHSKNDKKVTIDESKNSLRLIPNLPDN